MLIVLRNNTTRKDAVYVVAYYSDTAQSRGYWGSWNSFADDGLDALRYHVKGDGSRARPAAYDLLVTKLRRGYYVWSVFGQLDPGFATLVSATGFFLKTDDAATSTPPSTPVQPKPVAMTSGKALVQKLTKKPEPEPAPKPTPPASQPRPRSRAAMLEF